MVDPHVLAAELVERLSQAKYPIDERVLDKIRANIDEWPIHKTFMRIGLVQGMMMSSGCKISEIKEMIAAAYAAHDAYCDVLDHNDSTSPFDLDVGGEG